MQDVVGSSSVGRATTFPQKTFEQIKSLGLPRRFDQEVSLTQRRGRLYAELMRSSSSEEVDQPL